MLVYCFYRLIQDPGQSNRNRSKRGALPLYRGMRLLVASSTIARVDVFSTSLCSYLSFSVCVIFHSLSLSLRTVFSSWNVSSLAGRAGQIRIVDDSSDSPWGHINVDEIVFGWENRGGLHPERCG